MLKIKGNIGAIKYTNAWPINYYLNSVSTSFNYYYGAPSDLNLMIREGKLDISMISSFEYGLNYRDYLLMDNISISSFGKIGSILLFTKQELSTIKHITVALPGISATSVNLLKIILKERNIEASYIYSESDLPLMMEKADAALLIADYALYWKRNNPLYYCYDLGQIWFDMMGLPMTFAVCAVRKSYSDLFINETQSAYEILQKSKKIANENFDELITNCCRLSGEDSNYWTEYFNHIHYDFNEDTILGLNKYFELCYRHGLIKQPVTLKFLATQKQNLMTIK